MRHRLTDIAFILVIGFIATIAAISAFVAVGAADIAQEPAEPDRSHCGSEITLALIAIDRDQESRGDAVQRVFYCYFPEDAPPNWRQWPTPAPPPPKPTPTGTFRS